MMLRKGKEDFMWRSLRSMNSVLELLFQYHLFIPSCIVPVIRRNNAEKRERIFYVEVAQDHE